MRILCVGMMVCDVIISPVPDDILGRDSVGISRPVISCGGDALNVALGLAKLNSQVSIVGRIADDLHGNFIRNACEKAGIDVGGLVYDTECATAVSFALIDSKGERHFLTDKAIFSRLASADVSRQMIEKCDIVYFGSAMALAGMDGGGIADLFSRAHRMGKVTAMDAAIDDTRTDCDWLAALGPALNETDIFFPSIDEAALITGKNDPGEIAACFRNFGLTAFGIKLGAKGAYITDFVTERYLPALTGIPVVDTTGAGDSFVAGFLRAFSHGLNVFQCAEFANTIAAQNIGKHGGTAGIPDFETALRFYHNWLDRTKHQ